MSVPRFCCLILIAVLSACPATDPLYPDMDTQDRVFLRDAGWCWYQDPRALISRGKLVVGGISGQSGDIRVGVVDLETGKVLGEVTLDEGFEVDDHNAPVFYRRADNSLLAIWAMHGKEDKHYYAISAADDYLSWSQPQTLQHDFAKDPDNYWGGVTYMNLNTIERQDKVYNFFRMGTDINPYFIASTDAGQSWESQRHFIADEVEGKHRPYVRYAQRNADSIGVFFSDAHPRDFGNSVYYASFDGESFYKANGEHIKQLDDGPLRGSESEKIYHGSETLSKPEGYGSVPDAAWTTDIEVDADEQPHLAYTHYLSNDDQRFRLANWDGERWHDREIAYAGPSLYEREASYTGLLALEPAAPDHVVISTNVDPGTGQGRNQQYELYLAQVSDQDRRETIRWKPLTADSEHKNIRPTIVSGEGYSVLLWMRGEFHHFENYSTNIMGRVLRRPDGE